MNRTPTTVPRHPDTPQPPSTTIRVLRTVTLVGASIGFGVAIVAAAASAVGLFLLTAYGVGVAACALVPGAFQEDYLGVGLVVILPSALVGWPIVLLTIDAWKASRDPL